MKTNEIISMIETALSGANELLETAQSNQFCTADMIQAVSDTIGGVLELLPVLKEKRPTLTFADLLAELNRVYKEENACKNEAYSFIISLNELEKFNEFTKSKK